MEITDTSRKTQVPYGIHKHLVEFTRAQAPRENYKHRVARPDVSARRVWNNLDIVFFDVRIFYHGAKSNQLATVEATFKKHKDDKKRVYNKHIMDVERKLLPHLFYLHTEEFRNW